MPSPQELLPYADDEQGSHRMTIALETFTNEPLIEHHRKLITADDLRMMDSPASVNEDQGSSLLFRLPLWQLLLATISSALFVVLISITLILCVRERKKKVTFSTTPFPFILRGGHGVPDINNTPSSFLDRLGQLQSTDTIVRERDDSDIWMQPSTAHATGGLPRV
ncbi:unnamed protein product [Strongylus vulgaris]|uniref:Uncharacterized protein n=1 Tax=Strongylus vulgaris TaxID=40348 RepID=A0A3P7JDS4_STRVU|nr:unnamed protein product [Strongylus vulgaris]